MVEPEMRDIGARGGGNNGIGIEIFIFFTAVVGLACNCKVCEREEERAIEWRAASYKSKSVGRLSFSIGKTYLERGQID